MRPSLLAVTLTVLAALASGLATQAQEQTPLPQLGSPSFQPTPDRPTGWRGDGTGRFPAATPPTTWGRTIKGFYSELQCQAGKPKGPEKAGEPLNMGFIRDWNIIGPFDASDFAAGINDEIIKDETNLQPTAGDKSGDNAWQHWHISVDNQSQSDGRLLLDFALAYGKTQQQSAQNKPGTMQPWLGYAQTSIWAPSAGKVRLRMEGANGGKDVVTRKAWLNGTPVKMPGQWEPSPTVELKEGWNNLVVKNISTIGAWNFVAHMTPLPPYDYETKNIQWMTRMPGKSWSSPVIVGNKIFVSADNATLVCLNKTDGKVLWMRSSTYYHSVDAEEQQKFADLAPKAKQIDDLCLALPALINDDISPDGMKADHDENLNNKIKAKVDLEMGILQAMSKVDKKTYTAWDNDQDWSKYNPTTDGKYVWAAFWGGNKGLGANVMTCFDLDGNCIWRKFLGQTNISEHGTHSSPALCGDYVIFKTGEVVFSFEKATGKIAWQKKVGGGLGASALAIHLGKETVAYVPQAGIFRASDGTQLWKASFTTGTPTPTVNDGTIYGIGVSGNNSPEQFFALQLPAQPGDSLNLTSVFKPSSWKTVGYHMPGPFSDSIVGSPLYDNGLVYVTSEGGALNVLDAKTGQRVYAQLLDNLNPRLTWVFVVGICSSNTLGGKYIFVRDDQAQTLVIEPGTQYKQVAKNLLVELDNNGTQAEAQSNFYFEGSRIYFRSRNFMYCLGEK